MSRCRFGDRDGSNRVLLAHRSPSGSPKPSIDPQCSASTPVVTRSVELMVRRDTACGLGLGGTGYPVLAAAEPTLRRFHNGNRNRLTPVCRCPPPVFVARLLSQHEGPAPGRGRRGAELSTAWGLLWMPAVADGR